MKVRSQTRKKLRGILVPKMSPSTNRVARLDLVDEDDNEYTIAKNQHWFRLTQLCWEKVIVTGDISPRKGKLELTVYSVAIAQEWPVDDVEQDEFTGFSFDDFREIAPFLENNRSVFSWAA